MGIGSLEEVKEVAATTGAAVQEAVTTAADGVTQSVQKAALSEVDLLKNKLAAFEQKLQQLESGIREGLHNRVNEIENVIKRKFPYG